MEELHTIVDLSDPDEIRRDIDACATRWQLEKPWITRTTHRTVRVWRQAPAMRASRQWAPVFLRTGGGTGVRGDAEQSPSIEDSNRRPRARSQRPRRSTGGSGTTCGTKDTRPSRATQLVRPPSVSPSVGLRMRSIVPSARAALGTVKFSESGPDLADEERHAELPRIPLSPRGHQPRRLAVSPLRCERSRCRRSPGPTRHHGVLQSDPAVVPHVRFSLRSPAQASTGPAGRHLAPGRGLRHHPGTATLSLACRRSRWRRPRYPRPVAS